MFGVQCSRALKEESMFSSLFYNLTFINPADRGDIFVLEAICGSLNMYSLIMIRALLEKQSLLSYIGLTEHYQVHRELRGSRLKPGMT